MEMGDKNAESIQRSHNPMDQVENEQSVRPVPDMSLDAIRARYLAEKGGAGSGLQLASGTGEPTKA